MILMQTGAFVRVFSPSQTDHESRVFTKRVNA
jgi:hypothetical protein